MSITALLKLSALLNVKAHELMRRIETEICLTPHPPAKKPGRPKKTRPGITRSDDLKAPHTRG
jgi:hypothetical protein